VNGRCGGGRLSRPPVAGPRRAVVARAASRRGAQGERTASPSSGAIEEPGRGGARRGRGRMPQPRAGVGGYGWKASFPLLAQDACS